MPQRDSLLSGARVSELLRDAVSRLSGQDRRREAELLLEHALGVERAWLFAHPDAMLDGAAVTRFVAALERRAAGEPMAYILGRAGFWNLDLVVTSASLIPRVETELLVELALERIPVGQAWRLADLGTGSGAIALALAQERPRAEVVATDASAAALALARENASRNACANVEFRLGDWCLPLRDHRFHLIVSNPPYIADDDPHLAQGDLRFEPAVALASGADGLNALRTIIEQAPERLEAGGWLLLEHGQAQGAAVRELLCQAGLVEVETRADLEGRERVSIGRKPP